jgi:hypothetical protein
MRKIIVVFYISFFLVPTKYILAQFVSDNNSTSFSKFSVFREPSYILIGSGLGNMEPLIFEGNLAPYFMLSLNRNKKWGIELSPRIIIRMYNSKSFPIRTPSFMPKATFFYHLVDNKNKNKDLFAYLSWMHHSNGQDGSFYNTDSITVNTQSGNFSTNWISSGIYISRPTGIAYTTNDYKIYAAYNYKQEIGLDDSYGQLRFYFDLQTNLNLSKILGFNGKTFNNSNNTLRQFIHMGWIADELDDTKIVDRKRLMVQYTLAFKPSFLNDATLFVQYDYGQDYYNIYYNRELNVVRFGIASSASIFN